MEQLPSGDEEIDDLVKQLKFYKWKIGFGQLNINRGFYERNFWNREYWKNYLLPDTVFDLNTQTGPSVTHPGHL